MAQKPAGKTGQPTSQAIWERTKGVAAQIIEDDHQQQAEKIEKLKAARLAKDAAAQPSPARKSRKSKGRKA